MTALHNKAKLVYNNEDHDIIRIPGDPFKKVSIPIYRRKRKSIPLQIIRKIVATVHPLLVLYAFAGLLLYGRPRKTDKRRENA